MGHYVADSVQSLSGSLGPKVTAARSTTAVWGAAAVTSPMACASNGRASRSTSPDSTRSTRPAAPHVTLIENVLDKQLAWRQPLASSTCRGLGASTTVGLALTVRPEPRHGSTASSLFPDFYRGRGRLAATPTTSLLSLERGYAAHLPTRAVMYPEGRPAVNRAQSVVEDLLPVAFASRQARDVVTDACARWDLAHLLGPATLIVSELVSNAADHAHTMMTLTAAQRGAGLYLAVYDGSTAPPALNPDTSAAAIGGRGLQLVAAASTAWGYVAEDDGKTVWATVACPEVPGKPGQHHRVRRTSRDG